MDERHMEKKQEDPLHHLYKAISRPIVNILYQFGPPQLSNTMCKQIHTVWNAEHRTATYCHLMALLINAKPPRSTRKTPCDIAYTITSLVSNINDLKNLKLVNNQKSMRAVQEAFSSYNKNTKKKFNTKLLIFYLKLLIQIHHGWTLGKY